MLIFVIVYDKIVLGGENMKNRINIKNVIYLICSVIACALAMCFVDAVIKPQYFIKSLIKLVLFLIVPCIYFFVNKLRRQVFTLFFEFYHKI